MNNFALPSRESDSALDVNDESLLYFQLPKVPSLAFAANSLVIRTNSCHFLTQLVSMSQPNVSLTLPFTRSLCSLLPALPFPFLPPLLPTVTNWARKMNAWCFVFCLFCLPGWSRCSSRPPLIATVEWTPSYIHEGTSAVPRREPVRQQVCVRELTKICKVCYVLLVLAISERGSDSREWFSLNPCLWKPVHISMLHPWVNTTLDKMNKYSNRRCLFSGDLVQPIKTKAVIKTQLTQ